MVDKSLGVLHALLQPSRGAAVGKSVAMQLAAGNAHALLDTLRTKLAESIRRDRGGTGAADGDADDEEEDAMYVEYLAVQCGEVQQLLRDGLSGAQAARRGGGAAAVAGEGIGTDGEGSGGDGGGEAEPVLQLGGPSVHLEL